MTKHECQRCGLCCRGRGDMTDFESDIIGDCPHLSFEAGLASCDLHDSGCKPDVCCEYPWGGLCEREVLEQGTSR